MSQFIKNLEIKNFKSIKHLQLDCKRVNVLIGKPNVGKSNILEAMGLFSVNYTKAEKYMSEFVRYENIANLFFDNDYSKQISVSTDKFESWLNFSEEELAFSHKILDKNSDKPNFADNSKNELIHFWAIQKDGEKITSSKNFTNKLDFIKKYEFANLVEFERNGGFSLKPPFGNNLYTVLNNHKNLLDEIGQMLEPYGFDFVLDVQEQRFEIQKRVNRYIFKYPYISIADTFRRLIFHLAVIESNKNSVLILEEPEAHSYPPYIWQLANRIANDKDNQYFISTHSPYIIETLLQELKDSEINIWVTSFENYETKVNPLAPEALQDMYDMGADTVFFNMEKFEKAAL